MSDDALRILANVIRFGTVHAVSGKRVRVKTGGVITVPLPCITARAGKTKTWSPLDIGEQVVVFSPNGDLAAGVVLGAIYSDGFDKPDQGTPDNVLTLYGDGALVLYDQANHLLKATLPDGGRVELTAPGGFAFTGDVDITGKLHVTDAVTADKTLHAADTITSDADVKAGSVSLKNHPHDKTQPGSGMSGKPVAT